MSGVYFLIISSAYTLSGVLFVKESLAWVRVLSGVVDTLDRREVEEETELSKGRLLEGEYFAELLNESSSNKLELLELSKPFLELPRRGDTDRGVTDGRGDEAGDFFGDGALVGVFVLGDFFPDWLPESIFIYNPRFVPLTGPMFFPRASTR